MHREPEFTPDLWLVGAVAAGAMLLLAATVVASVLLAARRPIVGWERLKSILGVALWIVPAGGIVAFVAANSQPRFSAPASPAFFQAVDRASVEADHAHTPVVQPVPARLVLQAHEHRDVNAEQHHGGQHHDSSTLSSVGLLVIGLSVVAVVLTIAFAIRRPVFAGRPILGAAVLSMWIAVGLFFVGGLLSFRWVARAPGQDSPAIVANITNLDMTPQHAGWHHDGVEPFAAWRFGRLFVGMIVVATVLTTAFVIRGRQFSGRPIKVGAAVLAGSIALGLLWVGGVRSGTHVISPTFTSVDTSHHSSPIVSLAPSRPLTAIGERLTARQTSSDAPNWAREPGHGARLSPIESKLYASIEETEADVTIQAVAKIGELFREEFALPQTWAVPVRVIKQFGVRDLVVETVDHDFGEGIGKAQMYRAHLQLDYTQRLREELLSAWRTQAVEQRMKILGGLLGLVTLLLGTAAGYFRLDDMTGGQYRGRLKLAAAAIVAAAGLAGLSVV